MTSEQFGYWLQGYVEITNNQPPNATQWQIIGDHLNETLKKPSAIRVDMGPFPVYSGLNALPYLTGSISIC